MTKEEKLKRAFNDAYELRALDPALSDKILAGLKKDDELSQAMREGAAQMEKDMKSLDKGEVDFWDEAMPPEIEYEKLEDLDMDFSLE